MFVRVNSWIVLFTVEETIHEFTLNNTNEGSLLVSFLKSVRLTHNAAQLTDPLSLRVWLVSNKPGVRQSLTRQ